MYNPFKHFEKPQNLHSSKIMRRYEGNPLLTADDVPYPATLVFNAGVAKYRGLYYIAPRVDLFDAEYHTPALDIGTGFGVSKDGIHFDMMPDMIRVHYKGKILPWVCDARLTVMEDELYLSFCFENQHCERPGIARWRNDGTTDFDAVCIGVPQQRNMILCPEKVNGLYMRLERPASQWGDPFAIWYSFSPDMRYWGDSELLLGCEDVPYATSKIGGGAPMIKTDKGWLLIFHAVYDDPENAVIMATGNRKWQRHYTAGAALFDPEDPTKLIAITKEPLLVAEAPYETGDPKLWTEFTIFPCGAILDEDNQTLRIYYGAGDCTTNMAETTLDELWSVMTPCSRLADTATIPFRIEHWEEISKYQK
ncbi:MAG: glycosidase [Lentisphaerae bacterium]|nr:glycosidase [Lentisphaerota bacterium]